MKYKIIIFGCQFNYSDAERLDTVMKKLGYQKAGDKSQADLIFVLACSVRQSAIDRIYGLKKKWDEVHQKRPLITVLSGCVMEKDKKKMAEFFDIILPITDLKKLPKLLAEKALELPVDYLELHPSYQSEFQAYVPIMTGCNNFCAYCVVPYVRGREVSRPAGEIIKECRDLIKKGYKEITLLGQNVNSYKSETKSKVKSQKSKFTIQKLKVINFPELLKMIDEIPGDYWLRFVTSHPKDMSDELIRAMAKSKHLTPYLHLPVQAGDNGILKKMNRRYTVEHYKKLVAKIRKALPGISVSTDVIVGFPGETKKEFKNTLKLFKEVKFGMAYTAQYSERSGTAAARLKDDVPREEKKRREQELTKVLKKTALEYNKKFLGKTVTVLTEECKNDYCLGKTATFKTAKFTGGSRDLVGKFVKVKLNKAEAFGIGGTLVI